MMPLTMKVAETPLARGAEVRKLWRVDAEAYYTVMLPTVLRNLAAGRPFGQTMMYCKALQLSSTASEWERAWGIIRGVLDGETVAKLENMGCGEAGKQPEGTLMAFVSPRVVVASHDSCSVWWLPCLHRWQQCW